MLALLASGCAHHPVNAPLAAVNPSTGFAQTSASNPPAEKLLPGQMPYFDAVPDPIEGFNRCSWAVNDWLFRGPLLSLEFWL